MENEHILQGILTAVGLGGTYFLGRKKSKAEVRRIEAATTIDEIGATEKAVAIWRGLAQELRGEVEQLRTLVNELRNEIDELKSQNAALKDEIRQNKENINRMNHE